MQRLEVSTCQTTDQPEYCKNQRNSTRITSSLCVCPVLSLWVSLIPIQLQGKFLGVFETWQRLRLIWISNWNLAVVVLVLLLPVEFIKFLGCLANAMNAQLNWGRWVNAECLQLKRKKKPRCWFYDFYALILAFVSAERKRMERIYYSTWKSAHTFYIYWVLINFHASKIHNSLIE